MAEVDRLGWAVTVPLRAGDHVLGVRAGTPAIGSLVRELFADRLVPDAEPPANLSLHLASRTVAGRHDLHRMYVTFRRTVRTTSVIRALDALWHELDLLDVESARQRMQLHATVVLRDEVAYLLPAHMRRTVVDDQRRWRDAGFLLVDRRQVDLDPVAATITLPASGLVPSHDRIEQRLGCLEVDHRPEPLVPGGTWPIGGWALPDASLATRVVAAAEQVPDRAAHDGIALLHGLSALLTRLPLVTDTSAHASRLGFAPP